MRLLALLLTLFAPLPSATGAEPVRVRFDTTQGPIRIEVQRDWAPLGAERFVELVRSGYFDGARVFRVRAGAFAQFGIAADPQLSAAWRERRIPDDPVTQSNRRGTLSFAMSGPDDRTTQVFINLKDNPEYDAQGFAPFGRVVSGMDAADRFYSAHAEAPGGGIRGGRQAPMFEGGERYFAREFPELDAVVAARVLERGEP